MPGLEPVPAAMGSRAAGARDGGSTYSDFYAPPRAAPDPAVVPLDPQSALTLIDRTSPGRLRTKTSIGRQHTGQSSK